MTVGLLGILLGLAGLVWLSFRGWSVLVLAPMAALDRRGGVDGTAARELDHHVHGRGCGLRPPVLPAVPARRSVRQAHGGHGSVTAIAHWMTQRLGTGRAMLAVVLAGAA